MKQLLYSLNQRPHPFDPAQWPRSVAAVFGILSLLWVGVGVSWIWTPTTQAPSSIITGLVIEDFERPTSETLNPSTPKPGASSWHQRQSAPNNTQPQKWRPTSPKPLNTQNISF